MKYLYYNTASRASEGLLDRRSCLLILLAEAKLSNRIAVVPKFKLLSTHNNGKSFWSYLIDTYVSLEKIEVDYILEEEFEEIRSTISEASIKYIKTKTFNFDTAHKLVVRELKTDNFWKLKNLYEVNALARLYHGFGAKFVIPIVDAPDYIKEIGERILDQLEQPVIGLHLRRGDRLNKKLDASMNPDVLIDKLNQFQYKSVFYCTNDSSYKIENPKFFSNIDFKDEFGEIADNYLRFAIEMYVVDNCDISVRTFKDSSPAFYKTNKENSNYAICDYSMHGSHNTFKSVPKKLFKCIYDLDQSIPKKRFTPNVPIIPRVIRALERRLRRL